MSTQPYKFSSMHSHLLQSNGLVVGHRHIPFTGFFVKLVSIVNTLVCAFFAHVIFWRKSDTVERSHCLQREIRMKWNSAVFLAKPRHGASSSSSTTRTIAFHHWSTGNVDTSLGARNLLGGHRLKNKNNRSVCSPPRGRGVSTQHQIETPDFFIVAWHLYKF
jgi:hypothetical protein